MIAEYLEKAMQHAQFQQLEDGTIYGNFPQELGRKGVWADADTEEACRKELQEVLEGWILFSISKHLPIPTIDGVAIDVGSLV
jgi:predicted RNase H-like HicB family nuclease